MKFKAIALITFLTYTIPFWGQNNIKTDTCNYTFDVFKTTNIQTLNIKSLHSDINIYNWDKDSVSVETTVRILSKKPIVVEELLSLISTKTFQRKNQLYVNTTLDPEFTSTVPYHIAINVFMPSNKKLSIKNSYGKVNIPIITNSVDLNLNYCDIKINDIENKSDALMNNIQLNFSKGSIAQLGNTTLSTNSSEIRIEQSQNVKLSSEYSTLFFKNTTEINGKSSIDKIEIESADISNIKAHDSYINIKKINKSAQLEFINGMLTIANTSKDLKSLQISNKNTQTNIHFNPLLPFIINGEIENGELIHSYGDHIHIMKENNKISFSGTIGNTSQSNANVILFNEGESINLK